MDLEGILAITFIFGTPFAVIGVVALWMYLKHQKDMFDRKLFAQSQMSSQAYSEIIGLRQELAQLRDTSTQYDVSIQHSLEDLHHRVAHVEGTVRPALPSPADEPAQEPAPVG